MNKRNPSLSRQSPIIYIGLLLFLLFLFLTACTKWDLPEEEFPTISNGTFELSNAPTDAILFGEISDLSEDAFVDNHGHVWTQNIDVLPTIEENDGQSFFGKKGNGSFQTTINDLTPGEDYLYRAYIIINNKVIYGTENVELNTTALDPIFTLDSIVRSGSSTIRVYASISNLPLNLTLKSFGHTWDTNELPDISNSPFLPQQTTITSSPSLSFETEMELEIGANYIRPFLAVSDQVIYGNSGAYTLGDLWKQGTSFSAGERYGPVAFAIGTKGYIGLGGQFFPAPQLPDFWEYDPENDSWTQKADFPGGARWAAVGFSIDEKGYIACGTDGWSTFNDVWEYTPESNSWVQKADFPGGARQDAVGFANTANGYIGLGAFSFTNFFNDFWEYDPTNDSWLEKANFTGTPRCETIGFFIGDKGYVGLGFGSTSQREKAFYEYNPVADTWTQKADFGGGERSAAIGFSIGDKGYVGTGFDGNNFHDDLWEYDALMDSWKKLRSIGDNYKRSDGVGFSIGNRGYLGLGQEENDWWVYFPD